MPVVCAILLARGGKMLTSGNSGYLKEHDLGLAALGAQAERYFRDDPSTAIIKLRQFAELLAKLIAAHHAVYRGEKDTFDETLRRLSFDRIVPKEATDIFHALRKIGNVAVHEAKGGHADALTSLKCARQLGLPTRSGRPVTRLRVQFLVDLFSARRLPRAPSHK